MPTTINGIGTRYYGKSNQSVRPGSCRSCRRSTNLESYDTRLWFTIFYIPIIPIGRKRINDFCPACRRHYVSDLAQFVQARDAAMTASWEQFKADPKPDVAAAVHGQMLGLHAHEIAGSFCQAAIAQFPNDAELAAVLASQLDEMGKYDAATPLFERAYGLDPKIPESRAGVALRKINDGKLDDARELLSFLEQPGASQQFSLYRLHQLAGAFQKAGRHEEALALSEHLLREDPTLGNRYEFRQFVGKSEQATHRATSLLPQRDSLLRGLFGSKSQHYSPRQRFVAFAGVIVLLILVGLAIANEYIRQHRTVFVRNEFGPDANVVIDDKISVPPGNQAQVMLSEGKHHVVVTGKLNETFDADLRASYWQRWTYKPAWVINVGGASQLEELTVHYAKNPAPSEPTLTAGENLYFSPHVDYIFVMAPNSMQVEGGTKEIVKQQLSLGHEQLCDVFQYLLEEKSRESALRYAESQLLINPADTKLLDAYLGAAVDQDKERAKAFLRGQLQQRPVQVSWHRQFQGLFPSATEKRALITEYDAMLAADPKNAALLYLRGRLSPTTAEAAKYYDRSIEMDSHFSWPWVARAYQASIVGDWAKCKACTEQAKERGHEDDLEPMLILARLGLGEREALEGELRNRIDIAPAVESLPAVLQYATVLAGGGDAAGARRALANWAQRLPADQRPTEFVETFGGSLDYLSGDMAAVGQRVQAGKASPELKLNWLLATGKPDAAAADTELAKLLEDPWSQLAMSVAYDLDGSSQKSQPWREKAAAGLSQLDYGEVDAANMLRAAQPPTDAQITELDLSPPEKSLVVAALALHFPQRSHELAAMADRLAVLPGGFAPLVHKVSARDATSATQ